MDGPATPPSSSLTRAQLDYSAGQGCPDEGEFSKLVESHLRAAPPTEPLPIRVEVTANETGAAAKVIFVGKSGLETVRDLSAANCAEAAAAAALVVALAIDARTTEKEPEASSEPAPSAAPLIAPAEPAQPRDKSTPARTKQRAFYFELGAGGIAEEDIAPTPLIGASAFVGLGHTSPSWELRATFVAMRSGVVEEQDLSAEFSLLAGQIEACAFPFIRTERFFVEPCAAAEIGSVQSRGVDSGLYSGTSRSTLWAASGPLLRARHAFSELWLEAYAGPWFPIAGTRTYVFRDPSGARDFHDVPIVGVIAGVGLALRLD